MNMLEETLSYSDRVVLMHQGMIEKIYTKEEINKLTPTDIFNKFEELSLKELA